MEQVIDVLQTVKLLRIKRPGIVEDLVSSLLCNCSMQTKTIYLLQWSNHNVLSFLYPRISISLSSLLWYVIYNHLILMIISRCDVCEAANQLLYYVLAVIIVCKRLTIFYY